MAAATIDGKHGHCQATTLCVTGATGFVASSLVKRLLHRGHTVHATVRDPENETKVRHLLDIPGSEKRLKLFRADLLEEGSFDAAVDSCDGVFHVASPVDFAPKDPENDVIKPAINGTLNVLKACTKSKTVKRVIVTSTAATTCLKEDSEEPNQCIDETCWTDVDFLRTKHSPALAYAIGKTLSEEAALQYGKEQGLDVVTINPSMVVGSAITPYVPSTVQLALLLLTGNLQLIEVLKALQKEYGSISLVHVDDVCSAHIFLMENSAAQGRYICSRIQTSVPELANYLSKRYPHYSVPTQFEDVLSIPKVILSSKKLVNSGFSFEFGIDQIFDDAVQYGKTMGFLNKGLNKENL